MKAVTNSLPVKNPEPMIRMILATEMIDKAAISVLPLERPDCFLLMPCRYWCTKTDNTTNAPVISLDCLRNSRKF